MGMFTPDAANYDFGGSMRDSSRDDDSGYGSGSWGKNFNKPNPEFNALKKRFGPLLRAKMMGVPSSTVGKDTMKEQRDRSIMKTMPYKPPAGLKRMLATK